MCYDIVHCVCVLVVSVSISEGLPDLYKDMATTLLPYRPDSAIVMIKITPNFLSTYFYFVGYHCRLCHFVSVHCLCLQASQDQQLDCALDLMRRLPPQDIEKNLSDLIDLVSLRYMHS